MQGDLQPDGSYRWNVRKEHAMGTSVKDWGDTDQMADDIEKMREAEESFKKETGIK